MDLKNQLTKTPYLVLFIVLISIGVGTAYAAITITLGGDVVVTDNLDVDGQVHISDTDSIEQVLVVEGGMFQRGDARLAQNSILGSSIVTIGSGCANCEDYGVNLMAGGNLYLGNPPITINGGGDALLFRFQNTQNTDISSTNSNLRINGLGQNTLINPGNGLVGIGTDTPSQKLDVNGNTLVRGELSVGTNNQTDDDVIRFDDGTEWIKWDEANTLFRFSDHIATGGHAQFGSVIPDNVNRFGDGTPTNDVTGFGDLFVADDLEVGDNAFVDDHLFLGNSNGDTNIFFFDDGANNDESIFWDDSLDRFTTSNDLHVGGKLSMDGGVDPPYVSFTSETHNTIRELSQETEDKEEVMVFWNTELKQMEVYVIVEDLFYTFDGQLVE